MKAQAQRGSGCHPAPDPALHGGRSSQLGHQGPPQPPNKVAQVPVLAPAGNRLRLLDSVSLSQGTK